MTTGKVLVCLLVVAFAEEVVPQNTENDIHIVETQTSTKEHFQDATISQPITMTIYSKTELAKTEPNIFVKLYQNVVKAIRDFFNSPRVIMVLRSIGTCMVNGALEIITYYVPAPMIPLIASAAGMIIPFEPVVTLREKMPVTSYRRAFNKAVNSFMGTFDKYKDIEVEDPYMTKRFNRRSLNNSPEKKNKQIKENWKTTDSGEEKRYI